LVLHIGRTFPLSPLGGLSMMYEDEQSYRLKEKSGEMTDSISDSRSTLAQDTFIIIKKGVARENYN
jgi:hypothetical protein